MWLESAGLIIVLDQEHVVPFLTYTLTCNSHACVYILTDTHIHRGSHRHTHRAHTLTCMYIHPRAHSHIHTHTPRELESVQWINFLSLYLPSTNNILSIVTEASQILLHVQYVPVLEKYNLTTLGSCGMIILRLSTGAQKVWGCSVSDRSAV